MKTHRRLGTTFAASLAIAIAIATPSHGRERGLLQPLEEASADGVLWESKVPDEFARRWRVVMIDFSTLDHLSAADPGDSLTRPRLSLNLFDDTTFTGIVERKAPTFSGGYAFTGRIAEDPLGTMALVVNGRTVVGTVRTLEATYRIRSAGRDRYTVTEVDTSKLPQPCGVPTGPREHNALRAEFERTFVE